MWDNGTPVARCSGNNMFARRLALLGLPLLAFACSAEHGDDADVGTLTGAYGDRVGQDTLTTTEPGITLFDGYNSLFDLRRNGCVAAPKDAAPPSVGKPAQQLTIKEVKSETDLATQLGVDATFAVKAPLVSADASASLLHSFNGSSTAVNYLVQSIQSYTVVSNAPVTLTNDAKTMLSAKPQDFLVKCGDRFVNAVTYQAKIEALITFETSSEDEALKLSGSIGASGTAGGVANLTGSIKSNLSNASKQSDVKSSIMVTAQGFDATGTEGLIGIDGTVDDKLTKIDTAAAALRTSLQRDRDADAKSYVGNNTRAAVPAVIHVTRYGMATNAPSGVETSAPFKQNAQMMQQTENYLRAFGQIKLQMSDAWSWEISDFQNAGSETQQFYNVAPPGKALRNVIDVGAVASQWAARFRSDDGINIGTDMQKIQQAISTCAESAKGGDFSDCQPGVDPTTIQAYREGQAAIQQYIASGRVIKLRVYVMNNGGEMSYSSAQSACAQNGAYVDRLPTADEAKLLAPLVGGFGGGTQKSIWTADTPSCKYAASGMSFYANPIDGTDDSQGCDSYGFFSPGSRSVICVNQTGPVGKRTDL